MYYCRVVYVLLNIPMKTEGAGDPQDPPLNPPLANHANLFLDLRSTCM